MANLQFSFRTDWGPLSGTDGESFYYKDNLFIIAEGLGGDHVGGIARDISGRVISASFFKYMSEVPAPAEAMTRALMDANQALRHETPQYGRILAASVSVLYIQNNIMYFSHLGDSRIYSIHAGQINQLTRDHTLESDPIDHPRSPDSKVKPALTEGIGINERPRIEVKKYPLERKALIILTTEGFTSRISNKEILRYSQRYRHIDNVSRNLFALAHKKGGNREMTMGIIRFGVLSKTTKTLAAAYTSFALVIALLLVWYISQFGGQKPDPVPRVSIKTEQHTSNDREKEDRPTEITPAQTKQIIQPAPPLPSAKEDKFEPVVPAEEIKAFLEVWKSAWQKTAGKNQDMASYIDLYSRDFRSRGVNRDAWRQDKSSKGLQKTWIRIEIEGVNISGTSGDNEIKVSFLQKYRSSNFSSTSRKVLTLHRENGPWKIFREGSD